MKISKHIRDVILICFEISCEAWKVEQEKKGLSRIWIANVLLFVIGIIFLYVGSTFFVPEAISQTEFLSKFFTSMGSSMISLIVISIFWQLIIGNDPIGEKISKSTKTIKSSTDEIASVVRELKNSVSLFKTANDMGICEIKKNPPRDASYWEDIFSSSKEQIDICSHTLRGITSNENILNILISKANEGIAVRLLLNSDRNNALGLYIGDQDDRFKLMKQNIQESKQRIKDAFLKIQKDKSENFQCRELSKGTLRSSLRRIDSDIFSVHYLYSSRTEQSMMMKLLAGKSVFVACEKEFEAQFDRATSILDQDKSVSTGS